MVNGTDPDSESLINDFKSNTPLSDRQCEVLVLMGGAVNEYETETAARESVAEELGIQPSTVDTYYRRGLKNLKEAMETVELAESSLENLNSRM